MRLHVVSLPHTQTTKAYSACAYTEKVRKFCSMMIELGGFEVFLYAGEKNEAKCTEHICCISKFSQIAFGFTGPEDYLKIDFNAKDPWALFHANVYSELADRLQPDDLILVITGSPTKDFETLFPNNRVIEFGIGYTGIFHKLRIFESHAWRNYVYGQKGWDGHFFDEVIPNYFEVDDFPFGGETRDDFFLYIGRLTDKKGYRIAQDVCKRLGKQLIVAGPGEFDGYGDYVGTVGPEERARLMGRAIAVFVPTLYVGPFEGVHIEANLCGTPVITTDFGVFSETVEHLVNGVRCKMFEDFVSAAVYFDTEQIDYKKIRDSAIEKYSTDAIALQYADYFGRVSTLAGEGWYAKRPE